MSTKAIALTFDYELFLGRNHAPAQDVLATPTTLLLSELKKADIKATFFIDLTYLLRIKEVRRTQNVEPLEKEYQDILENISQMIQQGHELGIHFHPHWKDGHYRNGMWVFDSFQNYALHNLTDREREDLFSAGIGLFKELYEREETPIPSRLSFRAGGWCIHPFAQLRELFLRHRITIDSSVTVPFIRTPYFYPGKIPTPEKYLRNKTAWRPLLEDEKGEIMEIPTDTYFSTLPDLLLARIKSQPMEWKERGCFVPGKSGIGKHLLSAKKVLQFGEYTMLTLDVRDAGTSFAQFQRYSRRQKNKQGFVFLSHPKVFGEQSARMITKLVTSRQYHFLRLSEYAERQELL